MRPAKADAPPAVRVAIADDHPIFRDGLRKLLESEPGFLVVGEAHDGAEAIDVVERVDPDVLLLDLAMPRLGGLEALAALQGARARILVLTAATSDVDVLRALQLGARGVVLKESATRQLLDGIRRVVDGQYVVGEEAVESLAEALRRQAGEGEGEGERERPFNLTPRELDIIAAIAAGATNKQIAERLSISVQTVKHHLTSIFNKTGVSNRLELGLFAVSRRLGRGE